VSKGVLSWDVERAVVGFDGRKAQPAWSGRLFAKRIAVREGRDEPYMERNPSSSLRDQALITSPGSNHARRACSTP